MQSPFLVVIHCHVRPSAAFANAKSTAKVCPGDHPQIPGRCQYHPPGGKSLFGLVSCQYKYIRKYKYQVVYTTVVTGKKRCGVAFFHVELNIRREIHFTAGVKK